MEEQRKKAIRAVKKLQSSDIAVRAANKDQAKSWRDENSWGKILGEKAKAVRSTYGVIVLNVRTDKINPKEKEKRIDMIKERIKRVESLRAMKISWLGWFKLPKPGYPDEKYGTIACMIN